jgi:2-keto-4-pentenoate hydratase/2-oxohepta-3-ene-1,7-dioic acid hydratase in catechol pathway
MKAGDTVEVEISKLGVLRNPIADETPVPGSKPR